ncbi:MAG: ribosomal protein S18-alanine N-acetyltransferase [Clostridia bacterium]
MDLIFSNMNMSDLEEIKDILVSDFDDFWTYSILKDELNCSSSHYIVAKLNNEIVGFCGIKIVLDSADIMNIVVKKDFRNLGIGTALLNEIITLCLSLNLSSITLEVRKDNEYAISLYKNFGFETLGVRKKYYNGIDGFIMEKKIAK